MINFLKHLWLTLKLNKATTLVSEQVGMVKELNGIYYAVINNGLIYEIKHFNKFFNVIVLHKGIKISEFKYTTSAKKIDVNDNIDGNTILKRINIKTALSQILSDSPFSRCESKYFVTLANTLKAQFTSDDYLSFFFIIMDGLIYETIHDDKLPAMSRSNLNFVDTYSAFVGPFFMRYQSDLHLVYFDLKCINIVHFIDELIIEKISINYHNTERTVLTENVKSKNVHYYFESVMYDLVKMKASEKFLERCNILVQLLL